MTFGGGEFEAAPGSGFMQTNFGNANPAVVDIDMGGFKITNLADPVNPGDAVTLNYFNSNPPAGAMDTDFSNHVASAVDIDLGTHKLINVVDPTNLQDAATKNYVDNLAPPTGANRFLSNLLTPTAINENLLPDSNARELGDHSIFAWNVVNVRTRVDFNQSGVNPSADIGTTTGAATVNNAQGLGVRAGFIFIRGFGRDDGGPGGGISLISGAASGASNASGTINIESGSSVGTSGNINLECGDADSTGGDVNITSGRGGLGGGGNVSGNINIATGLQTTGGQGASGSINLQTGNTNNASRDSGNISIFTGSASAASADSGSLSFSTGNGAVNSGNITFSTGTAGTLRGKLDFNAREIDHNQNISVAVVWENGATVSRPGTPVTGQRFFDTTIGLPIWFDGVNWIDAAGNSV